MRIVSPSIALGIVLLAGLSGGSLLAQDQNQPADGPASASPAISTQGAHHASPRHQAKKLAKKLALSPDQESKLEPILADRAQQLQSVHADSTLAPQDMQARIKSIRHDSDAKVEALLTDTQRQQYEQMRANHRARKQQAAGASNS